MLMIRQDASESLAAQDGGGQAGVDDVLDDHGVAARDIEVEVLHQPDTARVGRIGRNGQEVDVHRHCHSSDQIGQEGHATPQHTYEHNTVWVARRHLAGDARDDPLDLI